MVRVPPIYNYLEMVLLAYGPTSCGARPAPGVAALGSVPELAEFGVGLVIGVGCGFRCVREELGAKKKVVGNDTINFVGCIRLNVCAFFCVRFNLG